MGYSPKTSTFSDLLSPEDHVKLKKFRKEAFDCVSAARSNPELSTKNCNDQIQQPTSFGIELGKGEYTMNDLFKIDIDKIPFLVEDFIPDNNLTILAGASDVGKSTFYTQLITRITTDKDDFLGLEIKPTSRNVLLVSTEDDEVALSIRIKRQLEGVVPTIEQGSRLMIWTSGQDLIPRLTKYLSTSKVDLIVIDALGDVFAGGMNQLNDVRRFLDQLTDHCKTHQTAVLIVHHTRKADRGKTPHKDMLLGSTGTEGKARSVLHISRVSGSPNERGLHILKANYLDDDKKSKVTLLGFNKENLTFQNKGPKEGRWKSDEDELKPGLKKNMEKIEQARNLKEEGKSYSEIGKALGVNKSTVSRWLKRKNIVFLVDESFEVP